MVENELSVAASYYNLFANQKNGRRVAQVPTHHDAQGEHAEMNTDGHKEFWVEDIWTEDDESKAEELLQSNLERCSVSKLERKESNGEDGKAWDQFYRDHGTRFFKDRHYLIKAFPEEFAISDNEVPEKKTLVEIGCGVGNALLPMLEDHHSQWNTIHGLDISKEAVELLRNDSRFIQCNQEDNDRSVHGHVCDISKDLPSSCVGVADVTTLLFCLSGIDPAAMQQAADHVASSLKPGGVLVFRDYGRYDEAQMKLGTSRNKMLSEHFYRKHDGTKCFYFNLEFLRQLFETAGLEVLELKYLRRMYRNNALRETRRRVWVQGRFRKPLSN